MAFYTIVGRNSSSYPIQISGLNDFLSKSGNDILAYAQSQGYNSVLLERNGDFYYDTTKEWYIGWLFNVVLDANNDIYLYEGTWYQDGSIYTGYVGVWQNGGSHSTGRLRVDGNGNFNISGSINFTKYTWNGKDYYGVISRRDPSPTFLTTLTYNKIYLNNTDITPLFPEWRPVKNIMGALGNFELSMVGVEYINDGNPVTNAPPTNLTRVVNQTALNNIPSTIESGSHPPYTTGKILQKGVHYSASGTQFELTFYNEGVIFSYETPNMTQAEANNVYLAFLIDPDHSLAKLSLIYVSPSTGEVSYNNEEMSTIQMQALYTWLQGSSYDDLPEINEDDPGEGNDPWDPDDIDPLEEPGASAVETGFTTMYEVTDEQLRQLAGFLWSDSYTENATKFYNDPREIIVGLCIMPVTPLTSGTRTISAGGISTGISGKPLTSQYRIIDCGSIYIKKAKGNFLDYPPYTKVVAHLPFVGDHTLDVNDIMGKTISLTYIFDFLTGSVVAAIDVDGSTNYFFGGSCGMQVPTSSEDFGRVYSGILSAGVTVGGALATIATGGMTAPLAIGAAAAMANNGMNMTPDVQYNSGNGGINGMLGNQVPFITIELPNEKIAARQNKFFGNMCLITKYISECRGFIKCYKAHIDGVSATKPERDEIMSYLMNGFRRETGTALPDLTPSVVGNSVILFVKCTSEDDVMGKTWSSELKIEGKLIYNQSILNPEFQIKGDVSAYNYAYIPLFNRYYYITNIVANENDIETVSFKADPLQSFKDEIDSCEVILERQENYVASKLNDSQYWTLQNKTIIPKYFRDIGGTKVKFARTSNVYILTIAGSGV